MGKRKVALTAGEEEWEEASVVVVSAAVATSSAGAAELDPLEAAAVSTQQPRLSVVRVDPLEWERAEAALASACRAILQLERVRYIGGLSIIMDELADL